MRDGDGNTKKQLHSASEGQPPRTASASPAKFTFINQHSDIRSVRDRRIQNPDHRHEIRSHVMRNVRLTEQNQGYKRPTGRAPARTKSSDRKASTTGSSTTRSDAGSEDEAVKREPPIKKESPTEELALADANMLIRTTSEPTPILYASPDKNFYFDPFGQIPGNTLSHTATESLLKYCFTTFMPMTFPVESKQTNEQLARRSLVLQAKISNPATFSGFLATIACHRAILFRRHKPLGPQAPHSSDSITDPDYRRAHHDAITATRTCVQEKGVTDSDFLEACFGLISTTTIVGDFKEARTHLTGVQKVLERVGVPETAAAWLPLADIKAALGMLDVPRVALPWPRTTITYAAIERMLPRPGTLLSNMAASFAGVPGLSSPLRSFLSDGSALCHMCDFNARDWQGLTEQEHVLFRCKSLELEHDLLKYVFEHFTDKNGEYDREKVPEIEEVVRLAILGVLCTISVHILPACGLGRAITDHQMRAVRRWFGTGAWGRGGIDIQTLKCVTWALFIFAHCAIEQDEEEEFKGLLGEMTKRLWLMNWEEVEATLVGFLYVPSVLRPAWRKCWDDVEGKRRRETEREEAMVER